MDSAMIALKEFQKAMLGKAEKAELLAKPLGRKVRGNVMQDNWSPRFSAFSVGVAAL
jgi:hypothetical protein